MNFKKYILPLCLVGTVGLQSCDDWLDTKPTESYSEEMVWNDVTMIDAFVTANYGNCFSKYDAFENWERYYANNMVQCRRYAGGEVRGLIENTSDYVGFNSNFGAIRNCNLIIERVSESTVLTEAEKKRYIAEGKMMRAMLYYDFTRKGGKFIWVDKVLDTETDFNNFPLTKSVEESYSYVLKDLREAVPDLPVTDVEGRLNKDAGYAFLSEVLLTAAAYTDNAASLQNGMSLYEEAVKAVDAIENAALDPDYEGIFNERGAYDSPEIILSRYWPASDLTVVSTDMINLAANIQVGQLAVNNCGPALNNQDVFSGGWMEYAPSQNLVDDYLVVDQTSGEAVRWYEASQFVDNVKPITRDEALAKIEHKDANELVEGQFKAWEVTTPGTSISDLMYQHRDKRFDASILHDGSVYYGETLTMYNRGNYSRWSNPNYFADHSPVTNYATRKSIYTNLSPYLYWNVSTGYHKPFLRYGRALLNKAEALLRLNRIDEAVATYNQTRTVHGGLPASTASTLEDARAEYMIERRVELFKEADFYFSLLRWGKYGWNTTGNEPGGVIEELCEPATFVEINRERSAAYIGNVLYGNDQRVFEVKSYLFPIAKGIINANPAMSDADQNPGWE